MVDQDQQRVEALGPAETIIQSITTYTDHLFRGRPGIVRSAPGSTIGVSWVQGTWKVQPNGDKLVLEVHKYGKRTTEVAVGTLDPDGKTIKLNGRKVAEYRESGLFQEAVVWMYNQIAKVWKMDNEFAARWASWSSKNQLNRDLKVILAAFMLAQSRCGAPVLDDDGAPMFSDDDYREVGEALVLTDKDFNPKNVSRIRDILTMPAIAKINRDLGFGKSARRPHTGRFETTAKKYLLFRENNPRALAGLVKEGQRKAVMKLSRSIGYKPITPTFFKTLRWKQKQAKDGRRTLAIGEAVSKAEDWNGLSETEICERIQKTKPSYKKAVGMLPADPGLTAAILSAIIENGGASDSDLLIMIPTLEEFGMHIIPAIKTRLEKAASTAENTRAANIAKNVKSASAKALLQDAADNAMQKALKETTKDMRIHVIVDKSGSMTGAIEKSKRILSQLLVAFPLDRTHVSIFDTIGREVTIKAPNKAAVDHAFSGYSAGGGTLYGAGVGAISHHKPKENEDLLMIFVGDECCSRSAVQLADAIRGFGLTPSALAIVEINNHYQQRDVVKVAANRLGIPCLKIDEDIFNDPYKSVDALRNLIASTPVGVYKGGATTRRYTLVEAILKTPLLKKPVWA